MPRDLIPPPLFPFQDPGFLELRVRVLDAGGIDIGLYKDRCVLRRLGGRLRATGAPDLTAYCRLLDQDPGELPRLVEALTVNVSEFFRNPGTFRALAREVFPTLVARKRAEGARSLRVWSAGCATGEEAYSLAITLSQQLGTAMWEFAVAVYATDVDGTSLALARAGRYRPRSLARVPRQILRQYFEPDGGGFRVRNALRRMVHFRHHNLLDPFPYRRIDLAVFRNVLIYMARPLQIRLMEAFYDALTPGGFLVLGKVEAPAGPARDRLEVFNLPERIYRKPPVPAAPSAVTLSREIRA